MIRPQVLHTVGILLIMLGFSMSFSLGWSLYYSENDLIPILQSLFTTIISGSFLYIVFRTKNKIDLSTRDGFAIVTIGWITMAFFSSFPMYFSLEISFIQVIVLPFIFSDKWLDFGQKAVLNISGSKIISVSEILNKVTKKTKIVFLANPNNPTGTYLKKNELLELRKKLRSNVLLVVDDAYDEYMKKKDYASGLKLFKKNENVIILRTFSKIYGLAALRIGWGYGPKKIIDAMNIIKPPFNVNMAAQLAADAALNDKSFINKSVKHNLIWANKIKKFLNKLNIITNEVTANFLLLNFSKCKYSANYVKKRLENNGIILRSMQTYKINNALRLTIGSSSANNKLIRILNKIFRK